jgi:hypothetical protein
MGEITREDDFGKAIIATCSNYGIKTVLEIGSWDGTGSTQCFIEGMKEHDNKRLVCLEVYVDRFKDLCNNTLKYDWVKCYNQSSISYANMIHKDFEEVWNSPYNFIPKLDENGSTKLAASEWFKQDIEMIIKFKSGYIEDHPDETYDAVLIDGGEFSGYSEFKLLKDRTNFFILDDYYNAFKTSQVEDELNTDINWEKIGGSKRTRNGWAIFKLK